VETLEQMKHYSDETVAACINSLLALLDESYGEGMHWRGQTPDWYVCAAMIACDIEDPNAEVASYFIAEANNT
jgi:hypothetical protein